MAKKDFVKHISIQRWPKMLMREPVSCPPYKVYCEKKVIFVTVGVSKVLTLSKS